MFHLFRKQQVCKIKSCLKIWFQVTYVHLTWYTIYYSISRIKLQPRLRSHLALLTLQERLLHWRVTFPEVIWCCPIYMGKQFFRGKSVSISDQGGHGWQHQFHPERLLHVSDNVNLKQESVKSMITILFIVFDNFCTFIFLVIVSSNLNKCPLHAHGHIFVTSLTFH